MNRTHGYISIAVLLGLAAAWTSLVDTRVKTDPIPSSSIAQAEAPAPLYEGDFVVVNLKQMTVELRNGTSTIATMPIVTIGKPGTYYETIGGTYENDYKLKNHFSSIGHVYMPWSVHVFGNFFIHGIPYYPDGRKVATTYSGGCIRLSDEDAKRLYAFVHTGVPIVITEGTPEDFTPTSSTPDAVRSMDMTRLMVATISLEVLTQDNAITDTDGETWTTRKTLLPRLLAGDDDISRQFARHMGGSVFVDYMNKKAHALGMSNTAFASVDTPATTTPEDNARFMQYIAIYKTYLLSVASTSQSLSR
jgi:hypothetical protein